VAAHGHRSEGNGRRDLARFAHCEGHSREEGATFLRLTQGTVRCNGRKLASSAGEQKCPCRKVLFVMHLVDKLGLLKY
jgi:hypothetical protein